MKCALRGDRGDHDDRGARDRDQAYPSDNIID